MMMQLLRWISGATKLERIRNERIIRDSKRGRNIQTNCRGKQVKVVWACIEKSRIICGHENDRDGGAGEIRRGRPMWGLLDNIRSDTCQRENWQGRKRMNTRLNKGV